MKIFLFDKKSTFLYLVQHYNFVLLMIIERSSILSLYKVGSEVRGTLATLIRSHMRIDSSVEQVSAIMSSGGVKISIENSLNPRRRNFMRSL